MFPFVGVPLMSVGGWLRQRSVGEHARYEGGPALGLADEEEVDV